MSYMVINLVRSNKLGKDTLDRFNSYPWKRYSQIRYIKIDY